MIKVTEDGIENGPIMKLTEEDLNFIREMFNEHSDYEKDYHYDTTSFYGSI